MTYLSYTPTAVLLFVDGILAQTFAYPAQASPVEEEATRQAARDALFGAK